MTDTTTSLSARRAITAAGIGNVLAYYDFGIYGFLASVIARKFFPGTDDAAGLLATFATFGVGFQARPVGGHRVGPYGRFARASIGVIATFGGPGPAALVEMFPTRSRASLMATGYAFSVASLAGLRRSSRPG